MSHGDRPSHHLDGNAAAGDLADLFGADMTSAVGRCVACGREVAMAETHAYLGGPGLVLRCPGCSKVLLRLVRSPSRMWLDVTGLTHLEIAGK